MNGVELKRVCGIQINADSHEIPTITLKIVPDEIDITGEGCILKNEDVVKCKKENRNSNILNVAVKLQGAEEDKKELKEIEKMQDRIIEKQNKINDLIKS